MSQDELRQRIQKALENKDKPNPDNSEDGTDNVGNEKPGKSQGQGNGQQPGSGKPKDKGSAPPGEGGKDGAESGKFTQSKPFTGKYKDVYARDYQFVTSDNSISAGTKVGDKPMMTIQWIGDDKKAYYFRLRYEVTEGPTEKVDDKDSNVTWLYFKLKTTNSELIDVAASKQTPFLIRPGAEASYRIQKN